MVESGGASFSLNSAEFSEFSTSSTVASTITVTGFYSGGGSISQVMTMDNIADGAGPLNDFQTEIFTGNWNNLSSVVFQASGTGTTNSTDLWAIDNISINAPSPNQPHSPSSASVPWAWLFVTVASGSKRVEQHDYRHSSRASFEASVFS